MAPTSTDIGEAICLYTLKLHNIEFQDKAETSKVQTATLTECCNYASTLKHTPFFHAQYVTGMRYQKLSSNLELFRNFSTAFAQSKLQINPSLVNTFEYMFAYVSNAGRSFFMWFLRCFHDFFSHGFAPQFQFLQKLIGQRSASTHFNMGSDHAPTWFCISHLSTSHSVFSHCICIGSFSGTEWYDACLPEQC